MSTQRVVNAMTVDVEDYFQVSGFFHDQGTRYVGKMSNDEWMRAKGFFEVTGMTARDLVAMSVSGELCAVDDDHAGESAGAHSRFQDRQDVHHHAVGRNSSADSGAWRTRRSDEVVLAVDVRA